MISKLKTDTVLNDETSEIERDLSAFGSIGWGGGGGGGGVPQLLSNSSARFKDLPSPICPLSLWLYISYINATWLDEYLNIIHFHMFWQNKSNCWEGPIVVSYSLAKQPTNSFSLGQYSFKITHYSISLRKVNSHQKATFQYHKITLPLKMHLLQSKGMYT